MPNLPSDLPKHFDSSLPPAQRVAHARDEVVRRLIDKGLDATVAAETADSHAGRIVAAPVGPVRVQDSTGSFYPINGRDPLEHLVAELWAGAPGTAKAGYQAPGPHGRDHLDAGAHHRPLDYRL